MLRFIWLLIAVAVVVALWYYLYDEKSKSVRKRYRQLKSRYLESTSGGDVGLIMAAGKDFGSSGVANEKDMDQLYRDALDLARRHPEHKRYALEIGRLKYGAKRTDKQPTADDEAAIRNDIDLI